MVMDDKDIQSNWRKSSQDNRQIRTLAELNNVTEGEMRKHLEPLGLVKAQLPPQFDPKQAMALYNTGLLDDEIAVRLGVRRQTIANWRCRNDLPAHPAHQPVQPAEMGVRVVTDARIRRISLGSTSREAKFLAEIYDISPDIRPEVEIEIMGQSILVAGALDVCRTAGGELVDVSVVTHEGVHNEM